MRRELLTRVLELINVGEIGTSGGSHLSISCIVASEKHRNGQDSNPSMTVSIADDAASWFYCHSCGYAAPLIDVVGRIAARNYNKGLYELAQWVEKNDGPVRSRSTAVGESRATPTERNYTRKMKKLLENRYPKKLKEFLKTKGIEPDVAREFRCAWDDAEEVFVMPTYVQGPNGKWRCIHAQARNITARRRLYSYFEGDVWHVFWGERVFPKDGARSPILVEGPLDCMHLHGLGYPSLALMGKHVSDVRLDRLRRLAAPRRTHIMLDPDVFADPEVAAETERKISRRVKSLERRTGSRFRYTIHRLDEDPKYLTVDQLREIV